jgi:hypothetical protein
MVRAILEDRKIVTRRIVKPWQQPYREEDGTWFAVAQRDRRYGFGVSGDDAGECALALAHSGCCPYGSIGDRLWGREAWAADAQLDAVAPRDLSRGEPIHYPADGVTRISGCSMISPGRIRPSIHMPRWACRILLEITAVRVERLQDISEKQSEAEGVYFLRAAPDFDETLTAKQLYEILWDHINGHGAWDANPWVWVVEFKRVTA